MCPLRVVRLATGVAGEQIELELDPAPQAIQCHGVAQWVRRGATCPVVYPTGVDVAGPQEVDASSVHIDRGEAPGAVHLRSLERRQSRSRIGQFKPIADFDWDWPTLDRDAVDAALKLRFLDDGANLVIVGAHGLGKTMLLKNIAHEAVRQGHAVLFVTAAKMLGELGAIDSPSKLEARLKYYSRIRFLCVDEVGYLSYDNRAADLLFEIVTRRCEAGKSMALTTNLAFKEWTTVFPHATCTIALVDRLTHRADILKIEGESWRRKEALERQQREVEP